MNLQILTLKTWLIILEIIQLVKYLLRKGLSALNEIKNAEIIKKRRYTSKQKELLNLFNNLLNAVLTNKKLKSKSQEDKNENENDKTLMSSNDDDHDEVIKILLHSNEYAKTINQNEKKCNNKKMIILIK